jgi:hypothetical protein
MEHTLRSRFVRYCNDVFLRDESIKREVVCKKLRSPYGDDFRIKGSVKPFAQEILDPVNNGLVNAQSTMRQMKLPLDKFGPTRIAGLMFMGFR